VWPRGWVNVLLVALLVGQPALSFGPLLGRVDRGLPGPAPVSSSPRGNEASPAQEEGTDAPEEGLSFHAGTPRQARRKPERLPAVSSPALCPPSRAVARASGTSPSPCPLLFAGGVLPIRC
jgi:hypothetical protein